MTASNGHRNGSLIAENVAIQQVDKKKAIRDALEPLFQELRDETLLLMLDVGREFRPSLMPKLARDWSEACSESDDDPFEKSGVAVSDMDMDTEPPLPFWFGLYAGSVAFLAGETGAGKTSLLYNIVLAAALNQSVWDVSFKSGRLLKVWYLDAETSLALSINKVRSIGVGRPANLVIDEVDGANLSLSGYQESFRKRIRRDKFDLVVLDPCSNLFGTHDENDNSEAAAQMKFLRSVARETGACILLVHHTGKSDNGKSGYGRGASARLAAADVGMTWRCKHDDEIDDTYYDSDARGISRTDECRLQVFKNRLGGCGSVYLRMAGNDRFEVSTFEAWQEVGKSTEPGEKRTTKLEQAVEVITELLSESEGVWMPRKSIIELLDEHGIGQTNADAALKVLAGQDKLDVRPGSANAKEYAWVATFGEPHDDAEDEFVGCESDLVATASL